MPAIYTQRYIGLAVIITILGLLILSVIGNLAAEADAPTVIEDSQPVWSPDEKMIAFVSNRSNDPNSPTSIRNIWIINTDGSNLVQITTRGMNEHPSWSPDGAQIAFESNRQLWTVEVGSGRFTQLTNDDRGWMTPDWHPKDASEIVCSFETFVKDDNDLAVLNPQTSITRPSGRQYLRGREGSDNLPKWSRDGKRIAFIGEVIDKVSRESRWYLMTMRYDGTSLKTHCSVTKDMGRPSWLPDGSAIVLSGGKLCSLANGKVTDMFSSSIKDPDVSQDGKRLVFCDQVEGKGQFLFISKLDGTEKKQLTRL